MERQRVLIIDDDKDTVEFFRTVLNLVGFECDTVLNAKEALAHLATSTPQLILLDMRLGLELSGEDILFQIRANPRFDNTRVIVITAYPDMAQPITNLADLVLLKPVEVEQLKSLVKRIGSLEVKSKSIAFYDPVTELYNQEFFFTRLEHAFQRTKRMSDFLFAVLVLNIKLKKAKIDKVETEVLIGILRQISRRLRDNLRPTDTLARLSGQRFAILLEDLSYPNSIKAIIERIREILSKPYLVEKGEYQISINFGVAVHTPEVKKSEDLLYAAERALVKEKV